MNLKEYLKERKITSYALAKNTGIAYTTINDLLNGRTTIQNISLKHAIAISDYLGIEIKELAGLDNALLVPFRYFRSNTLHELKRKTNIPFVQSVIKSKVIDYYYKNNGKAYAYYLLALIDYLCRIEKLDLYTKRYNDIRKEKLEKPFYGDSDIFTFESLEQAEEELDIKIIPEFGKFNIIEENVFNVA